MKKYAKFWLALVATILTAAVTALGDGHLSAQEGIVIAMAAGNALLVIVVPNYPNGSFVERYLKAIVTGVMAVLAFLVSALADGLQQTEILQCVVVLLSAYGVYRIPDAGLRATSIR